MNRVTTSVICVLALAAAASPQAGRLGGPAPNGSHELVLTDREMPTIPRRVDPAKMQMDADVLAKTASTIPADIECIRKGLLPKDVMQKLKEIEKLSKQLRSDLRP